MTAVARIHARQVLDSRGAPTVEVDVHLRGGAMGRAIVPSGASTGRAEACELRDGDPESYDGRGVERAVGNVNGPIGTALVGHDAQDQQGLDKLLVELDGTSQKTRLGANAILGVSLAAAHAAAAALRQPLYAHLRHLLGVLEPAARPPGPRMPLPMVNMISGGLHAGGNLDFQDFLIMPLGAGSYSQGLEWTVRIYRRLGELLMREGYEGRLVGDEGGYGPRLKDDRQAAEFVVRAIEAARLRPGEDVTIAIDVASTHFYREGRYRLAAAGGVLTSEELVDRLAALVDAFPITSIEDGLAEEDWSGWRLLTERLGGRVRLIGDDLFATNVERIARGIKEKAANSVLIKLNQIGTLTETLRAIGLARRAGMACVVSARSGETEDTTIADLAVGVAAEHIKIGSVARGERLAKYNRLLRIEEELGAS